MALSFTNIFLRHHLIYTRSLTFSNFVLFNIVVVEELRERVVDRMNDT